MLCGLLGLPDNQILDYWSFTAFQIIKPYYPKGLQHNPKLQINHIWG